MTGITRTPPGDLVHLLLASLEKLAAAGEVEAACRLAGEACVLLRPHDARATLLKLTPRSRTLLEQVQPAVLANEKALLAGIDEQAFKQQLALIQQNAERLLGQREHAVQRSSSRSTARKTTN